MFHFLFKGKLRLIAAQGSNVNLPCTFSRNQSDMVTLILFYRNASYVGQVGAPLYTLDARMMNDHKSTEVKVVNKNDQNHQINEYSKLIRQSTDKEYFLITNENPELNYKMKTINYKRRLMKRSANSLIMKSNRSRYSNERLRSSIGNVSMVNGISSLMHLLAIKGHINQSRFNMIGEDQQTISREQINLLDGNQTKLINIEKKSNSDLTDLLNEKNSRSLFYQLRNDDDDIENWPQTEQSNLVKQRNGVNNLFDQKMMVDSTKLNSDEESYRTVIDNDNVVKSTTVDQLENQPQHFVAPELAHRIRLNWPPVLLKQYQSLHGTAENSRSISSLNSTYTRKLESRSQTNHVKSDSLLNFKALLNIKNATEEDAGEYLCMCLFNFFSSFFSNLKLVLFKILFRPSNF